MIKLIGGFLAILLLMQVAQARYVRKQVEPEFFIPENTLSRPENLPIPRYLSGEEQTVKQVVPERQQPKTVQKTLEDDLLNETEDSYDENPAPDYQQKYEDYSRDLEHISRNGQLPENKVLTNDLAQMQSDQRIIVKRQAYQPRNAKAAFDQALQNSLKD